MERKIGEIFECNGKKLQVIEDPFDIEHNPGKSMKLNTPQYDLFLNCMKKEINTLLSGEYLNSFNTNR